MQRTFLNAVAALAALLACMQGALAAAGHRWGADYFPNLPVLTQDGKTVQFYDDLIRNKIVVISFIYTRCNDLCPLTTARMAEVKDKLGDAMGRDIFFISMSVDPERDTPADLKFFADAYKTGPGWLFVTGNPQNIRAIDAKLGNTGTELYDHRNQIVMGNDATGQWLRDSPFGDIDSLVLTIRSLDPKWRDQVRVAPPIAASNTGFRLGTTPGQAMFAKLCAPCHTVGKGDRVGPDLAGVADRRDQTWLANFIRHPLDMIAIKDPVAVALAEKYKGAHMPNLGVTANDATDLIAYLKTETARAQATQSVADRHDEQRN
jgi:cytochrome oxidase Cu insertion factor (SCO1/SenC/PrrC family)/cytochrome c2